MEWTADIKSVNRHKFVFRGCVLLLLTILILVNKKLLLDILNFKIIFFRVYHLIWISLQIEMLRILVPNLNNHISYGKVFKKFYRENKGYNKNKLNELKKKGNMGALKSLLIWFMCLFIVGVLYKLKYINKIGIYYIVVTAYFLDQFCINVWCPFRTLIINNKCCNACRIYNWDRIMYYSALIFIPSFWNYTLLLTSFIIFVQWEYLAYKYPERIYEISNENLKCSKCKDKCGNSYTQLTKKEGLFSHQ